MYARVSTIQTGSGGLDASIRYFEEVSLPQARDLTGFEGATALANREQGFLRLIAYWSSHEALVASVEAANRLRAEFAELTGNARIMSIEVFEVVLHEVPQRVVT